MVEKKEKTTDFLKELSVKLRFKRSGSMNPRDGEFSIPETFVILNNIGLDVRGFVCQLLEVRDGEENVREVNEKILVDRCFGFSSTAGNFEGSLHRVSISEATCELLRLKDGDVLRLKMESKVKVKPNELLPF